MQDSIYHMTFKSYFISDFRTQPSRLRNYKMRRFYGRQRISDPGNLHILSTSGLSFLMHDVLTLSDVTSYVLLYHMTSLLFSG